VVGLLVLAGLSASTLSMGRFLIPARAQGGTCERDNSWGIFRVKWTREVVELTNQHREKQGLDELSVSRPLTRSASWKSAHMAEYEYLEHDDPAPPEERSWDERVEDCGYFGGSGENIAYGYRSPKAVMEGWLNSPGHRANIERETYTTIGVGAITNDDGTTYWTQNFGSEDASEDDSHNAPEPQDDRVEGAEDQALAIRPLANDLDPDGDPMEMEITAGPTNGSVRVSIDGVVGYSPDPDYFGTDSFTYTVTDVFGFASEAQVAITVAPVNDRPSVRGETKKIASGKVVGIGVLGNDSDVEGDALRLDGIVRGPRRGEIIDIDERSGIITYRAPKSAAGRRDRIVYRVTDGNGGSAKGTLRLNFRR